jgi:hypothetical protein
MYFWHQDQGMFYLHEDDWGLNDLLPAENYAELLRVAEEDRTFGEAHFDGVGWTAMYVIPPPTYSLSLRDLPLHDLAQLVHECFLPARLVQSGGLYTTARETVPDAFAFVEAQRADGAFYGLQDSGLVICLNLLEPWQSDPEAKRVSIPCFTEILHTLGTRYELVLADWRRDLIIDLRERSRVEWYLERVS